MLQKQYGVYIADTGLARNIHHHIRYRVYCDRKGYEAPIDAGIREERDSHDRFATHFIIRNRTANAWQGTARLILNTHTRLPVQLMGALYPHAEQKLLGSRVAEVSRLAALRSACSWSPSNLRLLQTTITGLLDYSHRCGIEHLVFLIPPGLERIHSCIGGPMEVCGPTVQHRGKRRAFITPVAQAIQDIPWVRRNLSTGRTGHFFNYFSRSAFACEDIWTDGLLPGETAGLAQAAPAL